MDAGSAKPRPPIAGLSIPSGSRAGTRSSSAGRLDGDSSMTTASRAQPCGQLVEDVLRRDSGLCAASCSERLASAGTLLASPLARGNRRDQLGTDARDRREDRHLGHAAVRFDRVVRDDRDARPRRAERALDVRVLPESRSSDDEHDVVRLERLPQTRPVSREVPRELRVVVREPRLAAERLLPDRRAERLGERDERSPALRVVRAGPGDDRRTLGVGEHRDERLDRSRVGRRRTHDRAGRGLVRPIVRRREPVVHRRDDERRARGRSSPRATRGRSAPGRSCGRTGWSTQTG